MKIKNWKEFQHYKDRDPKWVKLYVKLLNDDEWFALEPKHAKVLVMLWLLASEDPLLEGNLPPLKKLSFRLRMPESSLESILSSLSHWVEQDASKTLASCYHDASSETEAETYKEEEEKEEEKEAREFDLFWKAYPRKVGKAAALKAFKNAHNRPKINDLLAAIHRCRGSVQWTKDGGQFIPHPSTWLNRGGWDDEPLQRPETAVEGFIRRHGGVNGQSGNVVGPVRQGLDVLDLATLGSAVPQRPTRSEDPD